MESSLELRNLVPEPPVVWQRMLRFVGWSDQDRQAALQSVEILFRHGPDMVVATYDHLLHVPETAAILGWERRTNETHLAERRRFFTLWLLRVLALDTSDECASYLFQAGKAHAGHGPRRIYTPPEYVTGSMGLVLAQFAQHLATSGLSARTIGEALAAWNKYLAVQQHMLLFGHQVARDMHEGSITVHCTVFGRLRPILGTTDLDIYTQDGATVGDVLRKLFNYYPHARGEALDQVWESEEQALWPELIPVYRPRRGWRVLLDGREIEYRGGTALPVHAAANLAIFPPGR
jgi:molybdopterin converting factor small subunit